MKDATAVQTFHMWLQRQHPPPAALILPLPPPASPPGGSPLPLGISGLRVLDLGCGSGQDCYVAASLVGPNGYVTGEGVMG